MKLTHKIAGSVVVIAVVSVAATGTISYLNGSATVATAAEKNLTQARANRAAQLKDYLASIRKELHLVAGTPNTAEAIQDFDAAWESLEKPRAHLRTTSVAQSSLWPGAVIGLGSRNVVLSHIVQ